MEAGEIVAAAVGVAGAFLAWYAADIRSKSRVEFITEKLSDFKGQVVGLTEKIGQMGERMARGEQDRQEIHSAITRVDEAKASKDMVDGIRGEVSSLKDSMISLQADVKAGFQRVEEMLRENDRR